MMLAMQSKNQMDSEEPKEPEEFDTEKKVLSNYAKHSGVAFQMIAIIGLFAFIGYKADAWLHHEVKWITALSCVTGVCLSIYLTIKQLKS